MANNRTGVPSFDKLSLASKNVTMDDSSLVRREDGPPIRRNQSSFRVLYIRTTSISSRASHAVMRYLRRIHGIGVFLGLICALMYSLGGLIVKVLNNNYKMHPIMLSLIRQAFLIFLAGPQVALCKAPYVGRTRNEWIFLLTRAICGGFSTTLYFMAISHLPLGDAGVIFATTPAFTTLFAWIALKEKCRVSDFPVLLLAFMGVVCILRPPFIFKHIFPEALTAIHDVSDEDRFKGCAYAITGAVIQAGVYLSLRLMRQVNFATISFIYAVASAPLLLALVLSLGVFQTPPCYLDRFMAVGISLTATGGHAFLTTAAKFIPPGLVSLTRSAEVAFGFVWQVVFLGVAANVFSVSGCTLVLLSMALLSVRQIIQEKYGSEEEPQNKVIKFLLMLSR